MTERVLVLAAHPDDETFGMGATVAKHIAAGDEVSIVAFADGVAARGNSPEAFRRRHTAFRQACKILGTENVFVHQYADNQMDTMALLMVTKHIETHIDRFKPTIVYTHDAGDLNIDHRVMSDAARVACRPQPGQTVKKLLHFEIPCSSAWGMTFTPDYFVEVEAHMQSKIDASSCYAEELREPPHPRSLAGIARLAELRGSSVGVKFAEAFRVGRIIL